MSIQLHTLIIQYSLKSFGKQMNRGKKKYKICKVVFSKCWEDAWSKDFHSLKSGFEGFSVEYAVCTNVWRYTLKCLVLRRFWLHCKEKPCICITPYRQWVWQNTSGEVPEGSRPIRCMIWYLAVSLWAYSKELASCSCPPIYYCKGHLIG